MAEYEHEEDDFWNVSLTATLDKRDQMLEGYSVFRRRLPSGKIKINGESYIFGPFDEVGSHVDYALVKNTKEDKQEDVVIIPENLDNIKTAKVYLKRIKKGDYPKSFVSSITKLTGSNITNNTKKTYTTLNEKGLAGLQAFGIDGEKPMPSIESIERKIREEKKMFGESSIETAFKECQNRKISEAQFKDFFYDSIDQMKELKESDGIYKVKRGPSI